MTEGEMLKKLIEKSDYSVAEFAVKMGITRQTLSPLFRQAIVPMKYKKLACEILGTDVDEFGQSQDDEVVTLTKVEMDGMQTLIKSMQRHIERLEKELENQK